MSSKEFGVGITIPEVQRKSCTPRWPCERQLWSLCSICWQGSSAAQMTAAKVMDVVARLLDCDGQAADAISAYTQVKMEDAQETTKHYQIRMSGCMDTSSKTEMDEVVGISWRSRCSSWTYTDTHSQTLVGKTVRKSIDGTWLGKSTKLGMPVRSQKTKVIPIGLCGWHQNGQKEAEFLAHMWKKLMKDVYIEEPTSFLDHVYLWCTQRWCKPNEKFIGQDSNYVRIPYFCWRAWSHDVEGHARKCVERYCELANKKTEQLHKVSHPCLDDHQIRKEELEMPVLGTKWSTWHSVVSQ